MFLRALYMHMKPDRTRGAFEMEFKSAICLGKAIERVCLA